MIRSWNYGTEYIKEVLVFVCLEHEENEFNRTFREKFMSWSNDTRPTKKELGLSLLRT